MRQHAQKLIAEKVNRDHKDNKKVSRNDLIKKLILHYLHPDSPYKVNLKDLVKANFQGKGLKSSFAIKPNEAVISIVENSVETASRLSGKKVTRSYLIEALIHLAATEK